MLHATFRAGPAQGQEPGALYMQGEQGRGPRAPGRNLSGRSQVWALFWMAWCGTNTSVPRGMTSRPPASARSARLILTCMRGWQLLGRCCSHCALSFLHGPPIPWLALWLKLSRQLY